MPLMPIEEPEKKEDPIKKLGKLIMPLAGKLLEQGKDKKQGGLI